jgi:hypothetical protein
VAICDLASDDLIAAKAKYHGGADFALLKKLFNAVQNGEDSPIDLRKGLRMSLPGLYAAKSAENGGEMTRIEYPWNGN